MHCPQCQHQNSDTAKFCEDCGARLITTCPQCGHQASPTAKFCAECGESLTGKSKVKGQKAKSKIGIENPALFDLGSRVTPIHMTMADKQLERLLSKAQDDGEVLAVLLFGSVARGEQTTASDVDVCLLLQPRKYDSLTLSHKKLSYLLGNDLDVHVFQ